MNRIKTFFMSVGASGFLLVAGLKAQAQSLTITTPQTVSSIVLYKPYREVLERYPGDIRCSAVAERSGTVLTGQWLVRGSVRLGLYAMRSGTTGYFTRFPLAPNATTLSIAPATRFASAALATSFCTNVQNALKPAATWTHIRSNIDNGEILRSLDNFAFVFEFDSVSRRLLSFRVDKIRIVDIQKLNAISVRHFEVEGVTRGSPISLR